MTSHGYPLRTLLADYLRAGAGTAVAAVPLVVVSSRPLVTYVFAGLICLFVAYGLRTILRQLTRIEISEEGIVATLPVRRGIAWRDLSRLRLKYFSTKRDRSNGWLQLVLIADHGRITVDSSLEDFRAVVLRAMDAARENGLELDSASVANLSALDIAAAETLS